MAHPVVLQRRGHAKLLHRCLVRVAQAMGCQTLGDRKPARVGAARCSPAACGDARPRVSQDRHRSRGMRRGTGVPTGRCRVEEPRCETAASPVRGESSGLRASPEVPQLDYGLVDLQPGAFRNASRPVQDIGHRARGDTRKPGDVGQLRPGNARCAVGRPMPAEHVRLAVAGARLRLGCDEVCGQQVGQEVRRVDCPVRVVLRRHADEFA